MKRIAIEICEILSDYHNDQEFQFEPEWVISWASQFDENDQLFILEEFLHLLRQGIYVSKAQARTLLISGLAKLAKLYSFASVSEFLQNVEFLSLQDAEQSQSQLLKLLEAELLERNGFGISKCGSKSKKYAIYLDDILATGNTVFKNLKQWLPLKNSSGKTNLDDIDSGAKVLIVSVFALHTWPVSTIAWRLKKELGTDKMLNKIRYTCDYQIENHPSVPNQRFNFVCPVKQQPDNVADYLDSLQAGYRYTMSKREYAFRPNAKPTDEKFFSSSANRIRFENVLLQKGIELLGRVSKENLNHNQRPLGNINPTFQTLGCGTLFFTWRNISNTTPIVFWWGAHWQGLFPLSNRGGN